MKKALHVDAELLREARAASGARTDTETVRLGLEALIRRQAYERLRALRGSEPQARATATFDGAGGADDIRDDLAWYASRRSHLERKYAGQYVAILAHAVVDHDVAFDALARRVFARFGTRSICMPRVGRVEARIRSPRRAPR